MDISHRDTLLNNTKPGPNLAPTFCAIETVEDIFYKFFRDAVELALCTSRKAFGINNPPAPYLFPWNLFSRNKII